MKFLFSEDSDKGACLRVWNVGQPVCIGVSTVGNCMIFYQTLLGP